MLDYNEHPVFAANSAGATLAADELAQIRRLLQNIPNGEPVHVERAHGDAELARLARTILASRRDMEARFASEVSNDPSIDLLLTLFIQRARGEMMTVSEACAATASPPTTALRRLTILTDRGRVERVPHRHDKRTVFVKLSDSAMAMMRDWLRSLQGVPVRLI